MYSLQVASSSSKNDIEKGRQDANKSNAGTVVEHKNVSRGTAAVNYEYVGVKLCCCNTRQVFQY